MPTRAMDQLWFPQTHTSSFPTPRHRPNAEKTAVSDRRPHQSIYLLPETGRACPEHSTAFSLLISNDFGWTTSFLLTYVGRIVCLLVTCPLCRGLLSLPLSSLSLYKLNTDSSDLCNAFHLLKASDCIEYRSPFAYSESHLVL